jgi:phospholipid/cholesterol/gamma-HCH transport system permease protein
MPNDTMPEAATAQLVVHRTQEDVLRVALGSDWRSRPGLPGIGPIIKAVGDGTMPVAMEFDTGGLRYWDTGLLVFLTRCQDFCLERNIRFDQATLPEGIQRLLNLARAVPEKKDAIQTTVPLGWLPRLGETAVRQAEGAGQVLTFIGETLVALARLAGGRAKFRWSDTFLIMQECGPRALGIVALINFLVGLILAFVGAIQLTQFGASIYVADLVAIATVREMGCLMTGIIVCGRTGAAFAAQLGTMTVNEEIDAFTTFGISPVEFLVLPRMIALFLMMPLLCVFADLIGILGGFVVSLSILDITAVEYLNRTVEAIRLKSFLLGIGKGAFFGLIIAVTGCLRGIQCGSNAEAVGLATTSAVVAGITAIIAADGLFAVLTNALGI